MATDQWTVEQALRWYWFSGGAALDPAKIDYLNKLASPFARQYCDVEGANACARLGVTNGMHLRVMGIPLKDKLRFGELIATGSPGSAAAPPIKIRPSQWDGVAAFDIDHSAASDATGSTVFVGLRISLAKMPARAASNNARRSEIRKLINGLIKNNPTRPKTKAAVFQVIKQKYPLLTLKSRDFEEAWKAAISDNKTTAPAWGRSGRPRAVDSSKLKTAAEKTPHYKSPR